MTMSGRWWLALAALAFIDAASAATITVFPTRDNTLYEDPAGQLSNGAGIWVYAGITNSNLERRALIAFDVADALPAGAIVTDVQLTLSMSRTSGGPATVFLHRVEGAWGEAGSNAGMGGGGGTQAEPGDATWIHRFYDSMSWGSLGGDFDALTDAEAVVDGVGSYSFGSTPEMVSTVQGWLDQPATDHGWLMRTSGSSKRFNSRETMDPASRPQLLIEYEARAVPVPTSNPWFLAFLGILMMLISLRRLSAPEVR